MYKRYIDKGITRGIHVVWYTEILAAVVTPVGVPLEEALANIGMNAPTWWFIWSVFARHIG